MIKKLQSDNNSKNNSTSKTNKQPVKPRATIQISNYNNISTFNNSEAISDMVEEVDHGWKLAISKKSSLKAPIYTKMLEEEAKNRRSSSLDQAGLSEIANAIAQTGYNDQILLGGNNKYNKSNKLNNKSNQASKPIKSTGKIQASNNKNIKPTYNPNSSKNVNNKKISK